MAGGVGEKETLTTDIGHADHTKRCCVLLRTCSLYSRKLCRACDRCGVDAYK